MSYFLSTPKIPEVAILSCLPITGSANGSTPFYLTPSFVNGSVDTPGGTLLFAGTSSSYLTVTNDEDLRFGTGDFTIEWWQYQTDSNSAPRVFSIGTFPSASIAVSIESGNFYLWINGTGNNIGSVGTYLNTFLHFAIVRSGSTIKVFKNGTQLGSNLTSSYNFNDSINNLLIGNQSALTSAGAFGGNIKGFHWVKGTALYSSTFTPNYNIIKNSNSKLLLNVEGSTELLTDSSGLNKTVLNTGVIFSKNNLSFNPISNNEIILKSGYEYFLEFTIASSNSYDINFSLEVDSNITNTGWTTSTLTSTENSTIFYSYTPISNSTVKMKINSSTINSTIITDDTRLIIWRTL